MDSHDRALCATRYPPAMPALFHLAFHVTDLDEARRFYGGVLGCREGRSTDTWVDFDFEGHQLSLHLGEPFRTQRTGRVGDQLVPMPHFGLVLELPAWQAMAQRLEAAGTEFVLKPQVRFPGEPGNSGRCSLRSLRQSDRGQGLPLTGWAVCNVSGLPGCRWTPTTRGV